MAAPLGGGVDAPSMRSCWSDLHELVQCERPTLVTRFICNAAHACECSCISWDMVRHDTAARDEMSEEYRHMNCAQQPAN